MNILDTLVGASFKQSSTGETLFYPWGILGRGYVVPSPAEETAIRAFLRRYYIVTFIVLIGAIVLIGPILTLIPLVPLVGWYALRAKSLVQALAPSAEKMTYKESSQALALKLPLAVVAVLFAISLVLALLGLLLTIVANAILGIVVLVFFGACAFLYLRMILTKTRRPPPSI